MKSLFWKHVPAVLAAVLLFSVYAGRNILFGGLITNAAASGIESATGDGADVRVDRLRGSWFTNIALEGITTLRPAENGPIRSVDADRISLRYNPFGFFSGKPLDAVRAVRAENVRVRLAPGSDPAERRPETESGPSAERVLPGRLVAEILDLLPDRLEVETDAEIVLERPADDPLVLRGTLAGALRDELRLVADVSGGTGLFPSGRDERVGLALRTEDRGLRLRTLAEETSLPVVLDGRIDVSDERPAVITSLNLSFEAGPTIGSISATPEGAEVSVSVSPDRADGIPALFFSDETLRYGTLEAEADARFGPDAPREVLDLLIVDPGQIVPFLEATVDTSFAAWSYGDLTVRQGGALAAWSDGRLTLRRLTLDAGRIGGAEIVDMVFDPGAPFPIARLDRADVRLQDLGSVLGALTEKGTEYAAPVDRIVFTASSDGRGVVTVSSLEILGRETGNGDPAAFVRASGVVDVTVPAVRRSEFGFRIPDIGSLPFPAGSGAETTALGGSISGEGSLRGSLAEEGPFAILNGAAGSLSLEGSGLLAGGVALPSLRLSVTLSDGRILVEQIQASLPNGRFEARADLTARQGLLRGVVRQARLSLAEAGQEYLIALQKPAAFSLADGTVTVEPVSVAFLGGELTLSGTYHSADRISGAVSLKEVRLEPLFRLADLDVPFGGSISAELTADGPLAFPQFSASLRGTGFSVLGTEGDLLLEVRQDDRSLLLEHLEADFGEQLRFSGNGRLPIGIGSGGIRLFRFRESRFAIEGMTGSLAAWFPPESRSLIPEGEVVVDASVVEDSEEIGISMLLRNRDYPDRLGVESTLGYRTLSIGVRVAEAEGDRIGMRLTVRADGRQIVELAGGISVPGLYRAEPQLDPKEIGLSGEATLNLPLEYLIAYVPQAIHISGMLNGTVRTEGTIARPSMQGRIDLSNAELRLEADIPTISALNGTILLDGTSVTVEDLRGELGYAPFSVNAGIRLPSEQDAGELDARLSGSNVLLVTGPDLRARADTDITVRGTFDAMRIAGVVEVTDVLFTRSIPLISLNASPSVDPESFQLFSVRSEIGANTELDLVVRADRTIRIRNNLYTGQLSMDMHIGGTLQVPIPTGRVFGDQGELKLPLTTIRLRQLLVRFPPDDPFSPIVQVGGVAQIRGYELTLNVSGSLPDVEVDVTSTPPLRQEQALVLLTTGYTPQELTESQDRTVRTLGGYIGRQLFSSLMGGGGSGEESVFDRVDIVIGKDISEGGRETVEIEFRLGEGDSWYLVFERDRYDRYNLDLAWRFWFE